VLWVATGHTGSTWTKKGQGIKQRVRVSQSGPGKRIDALLNGFRKKSDLSMGFPDPRSFLRLCLSISKQTNNYASNGEFARKLPVTPQLILAPISNAKKTFVTDD